MGAEPTGLDAAPTRAARSPHVRVRDLGHRDYQSVLEAMRRHTETRLPGTGDEIWLVQHQAVFTLGSAGDPTHVLDAGEIPVVRSDRGGQVTYHGPGQIVLYALLELRVHALEVRDLVHVLEEAVIRYLRQCTVTGTRRPGAPGVYVEGKKLAALGLRIRRGCSYHGVALNVDLDLEPFRRINPCGYRGLEVTRLRDLGISDSPTQCGCSLARHCIELLAQREGERPTATRSSRSVGGVSGERG